jgi:hypothetical protein
MATSPSKMRGSLLRQALWFVRPPMKIARSEWGKEIFVFPLGYKPSNCLNVSPSPRGELGNVCLNKQFKSVTA